MPPRQARAPAAALLAPALDAEAVELPAAVAVAHAARLGFDEEAALVGAVHVGSLGYVGDRLELDVDVLEREADGLAGSRDAPEGEAIELLDQKAAVALFQGREIRGGEHRGGGYSGGK